MANRRLARSLLALLALAALTFLLLLFCASAMAAEVSCLASRASVGCAAAASAPAGEEEGEDDEAGEAEVREGDQGEEEEGSVLGSEEEDEEEESEEGEVVAKGPRQVTLSDLRLTGKASAALKHHGPSVSSVGFSFVLSTASQVRVTLFRQTTSHGHSRWTALPGSITVKAGKGSVRHSLSRHGKLSSGRYMLTAQPARGRARSIYLSTHG